ncbi:MAG: hydrogen gas-evolving membrane-bound hydrogenase subunit E [Candidatus Thermoplasmatota archaeon]
MFSNRDLFGALFLSVIAGFLIFSIFAIHPFGVPNNPEMDDYIIDNCQEETGANNGVTSVVFEYRGMDTLGEATVLFTAVAAVIMLLRRMKENV